MTSQRLILRAAAPTFVVGALATITGFISSDSWHGSILSVIYYDHVVSGGGGIACTHAE